MLETMLKGGDQDDQGQDQEHDGPLDLQGSEKCRMDILPGPDHRPGYGEIANPFRHRVDPVGIGDIDLDIGNAVLDPEEVLRGGQRHEQLAAVVFRHAEH